MAVRTGDRRRSRRSGGIRVVFVMVLLVLLEFYVRPSITDTRHGMPDFLMLVLLLLAIREPPGGGAVIGFVIGLVLDVLTPARFGANILAHVLVGCGASWGRSVFFADNLLVNAALFFVGTWTRDIVVALLSGAALVSLPMEVLVWAPLQALTTAVAGLLVVMVFRDWLAIRLEP